MDLSFVGKTLEKLGKTQFKTRYSPIISNETDNLAILGDVSHQSFEEFEKIAYKNYLRSNNLRLYAHEKYRNNVKNSNAIYEGVVNFFETEYPSTSIAQILDASNLEDKTMIISDENYNKDLRTWLKGTQNVISIYE